MICDIDLPDISGLAVCRQVKAQSNAYVIMLTGKAGTNIRLECFKARADHYLDKQLGNEELSLIVRNICDTLKADHSDSKQQDQDAIKPKNSSGSASLECVIRDYILSSYGPGANCGEHIRCCSEDLAVLLNKSHRTFQREIKQETGRSFKQHHLSVRLDKSKALLDSGFGVSQVADALGFSSPSHLSRAFKAQFGMTPSKYRAS